MTETIAQVTCLSHDSMDFWIILFLACLGSVAISIFLMAVLISKLINDR